MSPASAGPRSTNRKDEIMNTNPTAMSVPPVLPPEGAYRIDPATSKVAFRVAAIFGLSKAKGTLPIDSGDMTIGVTESASSATATLSVGRFSTTNAKRDTHVLSKDFLDAATFPTMEFRSVGVVANGNAWTVRGSLTVHGTTAPVDLAITAVSATPTGLTVNATTRVDRASFGVTKMKGMVGSTVDVDITVNATRV